MSTVSMEYMRAIVEAAYPSDRIKKMPDYQIAAIYRRILEKNRRNS